jgi:hypothetical protein
MEYTILKKVLIRNGHEVQEYFPYNNYQLSREKSVTLSVTTSLCDISFLVCVLLTVHLYIFCNENQPDALFNLNLIRQSTSTRFGYV